MCAHKVAEPRFGRSRITAVLTWLGGGRPQPGENHEQSRYAVAGLLVLVNAALAWLVATLAVAESARWPIPYVLPLSLVFGLLVGAITRAVADRPARGRRGVIGRGAVAVVVAIVVSELAALVLFSGSIDRRLDEQATRNADSTPAVAQASANLQQGRNVRSTLNQAVDAARAQRDQALVVARCEYHPTPGCPQTRITGVPGVGPETRTANEQLGDAQRELDNAIAVRDRRAPELDAQIGSAAAALTLARHNVVAGADRGLAARWVALQDLTLDSTGALLLRLLTLGFFALLSLLPLILHLWRGETSDDRRSAARAERDRAELAADTAIAVKRAEVRAAAEALWAEQRLEQARLAVEAQTEIDRAQQRRRVIETLAEPISTASQRMDDDIFLPAAVEPGDAHGGLTIPTIPDVTKAAARWARPLVPTIVARAIATTTQPLRSARQVFEEVEEITFSFKRTRRVTVDAEETVSRPARSAADDNDELSPDIPLPGREQRPELTGRDRPAELRAADGPHQLPSAE